MKRIGFTLIELLAVIVILAVVSLIAVPVMLNVLERARKGSFLDSAYGIIDAAKLYYADASLDGGVSTETFTFPGDTKLKISGERPKSGSVVLGEDGKIEIAISNGVWCATKGKEEEKVTIKDYSIGDCEIYNADSATPESCFTMNPSDPSEIVGYTCDEKNIVIPSQINGVSVKKIGNMVFYVEPFSVSRENGIQSVVIPNGVTSIGDNAFTWNALTSVVIPNTVTSIGNNAFQSNNITSVTMSNNVRSIGVCAFCDNQLTSVVIPNGITSIESSIFEGNQLTSVVIPNGVMSIGDGAFEGNQLTSVDIPDGVTNIGAGAFEDNQLTSVDIPETVVDIGASAFNNNLFPDETAFFYKQNGDGTEDKSTVISYAGRRKKEIDIPSTVTTAGPYSFSGCHIESVNKAKQLNVIQEGAFSSNQLSIIHLYKPIIIGNGAFSYNNSNMMILIYGLETYDWPSGTFKDWGASAQNATSEW